MLRKLFAIMLVSCFMASLSIAQAAQTSNIGLIDVQKVFKEYKETSKAQKQLSKDEESFKKDFEESQKKLKEAEEKSKSKEDLEKLRKELEEKLSPKRNLLLKLNEELTIRLQKEIVKSVQKVADKVGIDVVVDKQVVIIGGMDLTDLVITELNK
ncbi:OmpH family outer membrane protein [Candidatus Saganbacteria bacterium]|nr:OmpH family outer membrane protein [Candidatus Saganbacteria bacterium]